MTTLYDYLASLTVSGYPLVWSDKPLAKSQIDFAGGRPYVRVQTMGERVSTALYQNVEVLTTTVDVLIYQAQTAAGTTPDRDDAMELYFAIQNATHYVDAWVYNQPLISIARDVRIPPDFDDRSGGLSGMVRFRLLSPRG